MSYYQARSALGASIAVVLLLSGCAGSAGPSAAESEPATPSAAPVVDEVEVARLVIGGSTLTAVDDDEATDWTSTYADDPALVITQLTEIFEAEPVITTRESEPSCIAEATLATWEGFELRYNTILLPDGQLFEVTATAPSVGGIEITTPASVAVGAPVADLTAGLPVEQVEAPYDLDGTTYQWVDYEVAAGEYTAPTDPAYGLPDTPAYWGAKARALNGSVERLMAPVFFVDFC